MTKNAEFGVMEPRIYRSKPESIDESDYFVNEEESKMFENVLKHFDQLDNKSDGDLQVYRPKPPPEDNFFRQDDYLDDSMLQRQNLN